MLSNELSLKDIERKAYRSTFEDGIYDIQFGVLFLVFALISVLESINISRFIGYTFLIIPLIIPWLGKRFITIPRMGSVEFRNERKLRKKIAILIGAIALFLTIPLLIMIISENISGIIGWKLIVIFAMPIFVIAVYSSDFPRLYIYAGLLIAGALISEFLYDSLGTPFNNLFSFGLPGIFITAIGIYLLIKFIRSYPQNEVADVE